LDGFKTHLLTFSDEDHKVLARNTSDRYFSLFKTILNYAEKDKLINKNVGRYIKGIGKDSSLPKFLTIDEIKLLDSLPYESVFDVKNAFLFACFTGLRYSDIVNLKWSDLSLEGDEKSLRIKQIKTEVEILIPLPIQALKYLPKEKSIDLNVFNMPNNDHTNKHLNKWKGDSLSKNLTFYMARHSYGTNLYNLSNDIYITSN
jgi:integrase